MKQEDLDKAAKYTLYGFQFATYIKSFDVQHTLYTEVYENGEWQYLIAPSILGFGVDTKEEIDAEFIQAFRIINDKIQEVYSGKEDSPPVIEEPQTGVERVQWLLSNKIKVENNQIIVDL